MWTVSTGPAGMILELWREARAERSSKPVEYCAYTDQEWDSSLMSDEHILPESIGGSRNFGIRAHAKTNADLGNQVDAPVVSNEIIATLRIEHGIKNKGGRLPSFRIPIIALDGKEVAGVVLKVRDGIPNVQPDHPVERIDESGYLVWVGGGPRADPGDDAFPKRRQRSRGTSYP